VGNERASWKFCKIYNHIRSFFGFAAGVAVLVGLGYITKEEEKKNEEIKKKKIENIKEISPLFDAPDCFSWHQPYSFCLLLLVPDSWNIDEDETNRTVYVTKERNSKHDGTYLTGFTVSCSQNKPKDYVPKFLKSYPGVLKRFGKQNISEWETKELRGNFVKYTITFEDNTGLARILVKCCVILNEETGTVYMVMFETKKTNWEENWATYGEVMTNNLLLPSSL